MDDHQDEEGVSPPPPAMLQNNKVKEIMGKVVSAQSAKNYSYQNIAFALYCYESDELRSLLLEPWFVEQLHQFSKAKEKKDYAKECLLACSPEDNNCPFILSNLTFAHFSNFLSTKTRRKGKNKGKQNSLGNASYDQAKSALVRYCGNESTKTVPFKMLRATEIKNKKERYKLTHMKILMKAVETAAERAGVWQGLAQRGSWDVGSTVRLYEFTHRFFAYRSKILRRNKQISWQTVYRLFKENRKVFAIDIE